MALILIRADDQSKLLNAMADIERHAKLKIIGKPKIINPKSADKMAERVLKQKMRVKSKIAAVFMVKESTTESIMQIKEIHPPAHIIVISEEYDEFEEFKGIFKELPVLKGYYSIKSNL